MSKIEITVGGKKIKLSEETVANIKEQLLNEDEWEVYTDEGWVSGDGNPMEVFELVREINYDYPDTYLFGSTKCSYYLFETDYNYHQLWRQKK